MGIKHTIRSFRHDINYCLKDKLTQATGTVERQIAYRQRAEIIHFNQCYGTKPELVRQFREVTELNHNICEPYLHIVLSLPPQDHLSNSQWADVSVECSKALGFERNQYIAIRHRDRPHEHIHILANRINFQGDVVQDRYLLRKINNFCLQAEIDHGLTRTEGMRCFLPKELRDTPRYGERLHRLQETITTSLATASTISSFQEDMRAQGYKVYRNERGIAFHEEKGVIYRGYETGYPWKKIEHILGENAALELKQKQELEQRRSQETAEEERQVQRHGHRLNL